MGAHAHPETSPLMHPPTNIGTLLTATLLISPSSELPPPSDWGPSICPFFSFKSRVRMSDPLSFFLFHSDDAFLAQPSLCNGGTTPRRSCPLTSSTVSLPSYLTALPPRIISFFLISFRPPRYGLMYSFPSLTVRFQHLGCFFLSLFVDNPHKSPSPCFTLAKTRLPRAFFLALQSWARNLLPF